jgi:flagellar hook-basal body complex protein FliE
VAIAPIGSAGAVAGNFGIAPATAKVDSAGGHGFGDLITKALNSVEGAQAKSDNLATKAATGQLSDVHDYMLASTEASVATELTVAVRNKAVESFNEIMRMAV